MKILIAKSILKIASISYAIKKYLHDNLADLIFDTTIFISAACLSILPPIIFCACFEWFYNFQKIANSATVFQVYYAGLATLLLIYDKSKYMYNWAKNIDSQRRIEFNNRHNPNINVGETNLDVRDVNINPTSHQLPSDYKDPSLLSQLTFAYTFATSPRFCANDQYYDCYTLLFSDVNSLNALKDLNKTIAIYTLKYDTNNHILMRYTTLNNINEVPPSKIETPKEELVPYKPTSKIETPKEELVPYKPINAIMELEL